MNTRIVAIALFIISIAIFGITPNCSGAFNDGFSGIRTLRLYCDHDSDHNEILGINRDELVTFQIEVNGPAPLDDNGHVALYRDTIIGGEGASAEYDQEGYFLLENGLQEAHRDVWLPQGVHKPSCMHTNGDEVVPNIAGSYDVYAWLWNSVNNNGQAPYEKIWSNVIGQNDPTQKSNCLPRTIKVVSLDMEIYSPKAIDQNEGMISEENENTTGSITFINTDDDDRDGVEDNTDQEVSGGDDDLLKINLKVRPGNLYLGTFRVISTQGASSIRIWNTPTRTEEYTLNTDIQMTELTGDDSLKIKTLWVEGIGASSQACETQLQFEYYRNGQVEPALFDAVKLTVLSSTEVSITPDHKSMSPYEQFTFSSSCTDQFGVQRNITPTWSVSGGTATISEGGNFDPDGNCGVFTIRAAIGGAFDTAIATVHDSDETVISYLSPIDNTMQQYEVHVPSGYQPGTKIGVVLCGEGNRGLFNIFPLEVPHFANRQYCSSWQIAFSNEKNYLYVYLNSRGNTYGLGLAEEDLLSVIDDIKRKYTIDDKKIYFEGWCMSASASYRHSVNYPHLLAGFGAVDGWAY